MPSDVADEVGVVAADAGATPAQVALAWLLSKWDDIVPIPGTKRTTRVEENCAADGIELSSETDPNARQPVLRPETAGAESQSKPGRHEAQLATLLVPTLATPLDPPTTIHVDCLSRRQRQG